MLFAVIMLLPFSMKFKVYGLMIQLAYIYTSLNGISFHYIFPFILRHSLDCNWS